jgi:hypothetical protein
VLKDGESLNHVALWVVLSVLQDGNIISHLLCSLTDAKWASFCSNIQQDAPELPGGVSEVNSIADLSQTLNTDDGIVVDAGREVCVKLYLGQVSLR